MLKLRKMNMEDAKQQWEYVTAMPADENGVTNSHEGVSGKRLRYQGNGIDAGVGEENRAGRGNLSAGTQEQYTFL